MDFITHSLLGAGTARLASPRRELLGQLSFAGLLGSLLPDADSWLALLGPQAYGLYHRLVSHSAVGLAAISVFAALLAWLFAHIGRWRRFGWFIADNLPIAPRPARASFVRLWTVALAAVMLHWCADVITGFGNMAPLWPWSHADWSLRAVSSFDAVIFVSTFAWHVALRRLNRPRRREILLTAAYLLAIVLYVAARWKWSAPSII